MHKATISGVGHYVPEKIVTNFDLEKIMDTSDEWIRERSGIEERRWVEDGEDNVDLAEQASRKAIEDAKLKPEDIDFIIPSVPEEIRPSAEKKKPERKPAAKKTQKSD